jgi:hypothetical protein
VVQSAVLLFVIAIIVKYVTEKENANQNVTNAKDANVEIVYLIVAYYVKSAKIINVLQNATLLNAKHATLEVIV